MLNKIEKWREIQISNTKSDNFAFFLTVCAGAFQLNHPEASVINRDVNKVLQEVPKNIDTIATVENLSKTKKNTDTIVTLKKLPQSKNTDTKTPENDVTKNVSHQSKGKQFRIFDDFVDFENVNKFQFPANFRNFANLNRINFPLILNILNRKQI